MGIVRIKKQFFPRDQIDDVLRSISLNEQEKNGFLCIFGQCFRQFFDTSLRNPKNMLKSCLRASQIWKQNWKTLTGSFFIVFLLFRPIVEIVYILFRSHCIIPDSIQNFELKLHTQTKFDTLISNLKSNFQYDIVMTL